MAAERKTSWAKLRVGIVAIVGMVILAVIVYLITGNTSLFQREATLFTYMNDAAALQEGAPVNLNGILIGKLKKIMLSGSRQANRIVRIEMEVEQQNLPQIPNDSLVEISAANVLGTKYINIKKGKSGTTIRDGQELPALNTAEFEDVVQQGYAVLTSLQGIVLRVDHIVGLIENGQGSLGKVLVDNTLYDHLLAIVAQIQQLVAALNSNKGTVGKLIYDPTLYDQVNSTVKRLGGIIDDLQSGQGTAGKLLKDPAMYDDLRQTIAQANQILADINAGKGTAGKLLKSDELANQLAATINRLDLILDKVNSGQGTVGQLLVNSSLFDNLNGATREMHGLMQDFRANPKKFLRIKLSLF